MQRLRVRFSRGPELKYLSHLDNMRLWHRAFNRAGIPMAYSEGFKPHPRMSLAAPLAVGVTSEAELLDIMVTRAVSPHYFTSAVEQQLPLGMEIMLVYPLAPILPSLQSQIRFAEYRVELETDKSPAEIESALASLLSLEKLPWQHQRDTGPRNYDLRALVDDLWLIAAGDGRAAIGMRLRCGSNGAGRPEQVAAALGFTRPPESLHRTRLILQGG
ncbi:MAG: TIGR03936 family radical SAM-associated protein [Dehalococcoidales bacterium]